MLSKIFAKLVLFSYFNRCVISQVVSVSGSRKYKNSANLYWDTREMVESEGYVCEEHSVLTEDGYLLKMFRLPKFGPAILLSHGIGDSSDSWVVLGKEYSLAYLLADAGFDVWLANSRGNKYSKGHSKYIPSSERYWHFSFEEVGSKDLPACIDYILNTTKGYKINYIGFSQGTTTFLIMCAMRPEYNDKIAAAYLLAPVTWPKYMKHPLVGVIAQNYRTFLKLVKTFSIYEVFQSNMKRQSFHAQTCRRFVTAKVICDLEYFVYYGLNTSRVPADRFVSVTTHIPAGTSAYSFLHYVQNYLTGKFQRYDYDNGIEKHKNIAMTEEYDLTKISAPVIIFSSESDWYSDVRDANRLRLTLPNVREFVSLNSTLKFTHLEYAYGALAKPLVYDKILEKLKYDNEM